MYLNYEVSEEHYAQWKNTWLPTLIMIPERFHHYFTCNYLLRLTCNGYPDSLLSEDGGK